MQGQALARVTSPGGDWAYTLYGGDHAFVHALQLTRAAARRSASTWKGFH